MQPQPNIETLDCGHPPSEHSEITTGYARLALAQHVNGRELQEGALVCYDCAADLDRKRARAGQPVSGYVSGDHTIEPRAVGWEVTTWAGRPLGKITLVKPFWQPTANGRIRMYSVRAELEGRPYFGRTQGPGMYVRLRPAKAKGGDA